MERMKLLVVVALALVICLPGMSSAATFFGQDLNGGNPPASHPNADAARDAFLAVAGSYGTENFDSIVSGTIAPSL